VILKHNNRASWDTRLESKPGHRLSSTASWFSSVPVGKQRDITFS
jgi:hypothetical protein